MAGDRYPGSSSSPSLERRFKALEARIRSIERSTTVADSVAAKRVTVAEQEISETADDLAAHEDATDPHPQYLTEDEGDARYDPIGAVAAHEAEDDPHSQYLTQAEADALYSSAGFDDTDIDGGVATSHYLGLYADGGATYNEPLTEGAIDGGGAEWL